jgi:AraC-like DNA-binding protein
MLAGTGDVAADASQRYARSRLTESAARRMLLELDCRMRDEHWYRDITLSLTELARRLDTRPHLLSQALNQVKGTTLNDYLLSWRLAEAKRLLIDPASDRFTIDALAESAGFASRSAFYKAFKGHEGVTPTEFRARSRAALRST